MNPVRQMALRAVLLAATLALNCDGRDSSPAPATVMPAPTGSCPVTPSLAVSGGMGQVALGAARLVNDGGVVPFSFATPDAPGRAKGLWAVRRVGAVDAMITGRSVQTGDPLRFDVDGVVVDHLSVPGKGTVGTGSSAGFAFTSSALVIASLGCYEYEISAGPYTERAWFLAVDEGSLLDAPDLQVRRSDPGGILLVSTAGLGYASFWADRSSGVAAALQLSDASSQQGEGVAGGAGDNVMVLPDPPSTRGAIATGVTARPRGVQLSPNGRLAAFYSLERDPRGVVEVLDMPRGLRTPVMVGWDVRWSPDSSRLAIVSEQDQAGGLPSANSEIYLASPPAVETERLTTSDEWEGRPRWSPDGTRLMFQAMVDRHTVIRVLDLQSRQTGDLVSPPAHDAFAEWSPDGARIAFASDRGGGFHLFLVNADGSDLHQLTSGEGSDWAPAWSPDGERIAFISSRDGIPEVFVVNADGSDIQRATVTTGGWVTGVGWVD